MTTNKQEKPIIAIISDDFSPPRTGVGVSLNLLVPELTNLGYKIVIITSKDKLQNSIESLPNIKIYRLTSIKLFGFLQAITTVKKLKSILTENKVQIVYHNYLSGLTLQVMRAAGSLKIPQMATAHMTAIHLTQPILLKPLKPIINFFIFKFYKTIQMITSPSIETATEIENRINKKVIIISNPLPDFTNNTLQTLAKNSNSLESINKNKKLFNILFVGRLDEEKNVEFLLKTFIKYKKQYKTNSILTIAGDGRCKEKLKNIIDKNDFTESVKLLGWVDRSEIQNVYSNASVFVLPSIHETQGIVVMEALSFGLPVLANKTLPCSREFIINAHNGFQINISNSNDLIDKLNLVESNLNLLKKLSANARTTINKESYSTKNIALKYNDIFNQLTNIEFSQSIFNYRSS